MTAPTRHKTCRYTRRNGDLCTAEAVDDLGEIVLCSRHMGLAVELLLSHGFTIEPPKVPAHTG